MEIKDAILRLRTQRGLTQSQFAQQIHVTRQAVSRWETGNTYPSTDTLKAIAAAFHVPVEQLLGEPSGQCQSCGMPLRTPGDRGTEPDGSPAADYCAFCYQQGRFLLADTVEEMAELNLRSLDDWNRENGLHLTAEEARQELLRFLPTLKRWKKA